MIAFITVRLILLIVVVLFLVPFRAFPCMDEAKTNGHIYALFIYTHLAYEANCTSLSPARLR